jgi:hypothetical protein
METRVVGVRRSAPLECSHQVDVHTVGNDHLGVVEVARRLRDTLVKQEQLRPVDAQIGVHPVVLEPHGARRRLQIGVRAVPASERRIGGVLFEQAYDVADVVDDVAQKDGRIAVVNHGTVRGRSSAYPTWGRRGAPAAGSAETPRARRTAQIPWRRDEVSVAGKG